MPKLDKIMTRGGDQGQTSLVNGARVSKGSQRVNTYGSIDELNSILGVVRCEPLPEEIAAKLLQLQNELFNLGSELATPIDSDTYAQVPHMKQEQIDRLENWLEEARDILTPAANFILPGGTRAAANLHLARTVTRRCEREMVLLAETEEINPLCLKFVNRLSDLCFVWARLCNDYGKADIYWHADLPSA